MTMNENNLQSYHIEDMAWKRNGLCSKANEEDRELFYGPDREIKKNKKLREAKAVEICKKCPIIQECLSLAIATGEIHGVWGGKTEEQRSGIRKTNLQKNVLYRSRSA
jgi:WhiB family redox-sensing transcriptional regulator